MALHYVQCLNPFPPSLLFFSLPSLSHAVTGSETSSIASHSSTSLGGTSLVTTVDGGGRSSPRAYWKSFISGIQRVVLFTSFIETIDRIKAVGSYTRPQIEVSLGLSALGLSLVDNTKKRELAYIAIKQSGVIWQVEKARKRWKTLNNSIITLLEDAHLKKEIDVKYKNVSVSIIDQRLQYTYVQYKYIH